jgi:hypothetical protein
LPPTDEPDLVEYDRDPDSKLTDESQRAPDKTTVAPIGLSKKAILPEAKVSL